MKSHDEMTPADRGALAARKDNANDAKEEWRGELQTVDTGLILDAIKGEVDLIDLMKDEMASRGLDANGLWIGFDAAEKLWKTLYWDGRNLIAKIEGKE